MPEFPFDEAIPLNGTVGSFTDLAQGAPIAEARPVLRVAVFGDVVSDSNAMGLADDISLIVHACLHDLASVERQTPPTASAPSSDPDADIQIAVHGLNLDRESEHKLQGLIRALVRDRVAGGQRQR